MSEDMKLDITMEDLEELEEVYGKDDPDIQEALGLSDSATPAAMGDRNLDDPINSPGSKGLLEDSGMESGGRPTGTVPVAALQEERKKRQEAAQKAQHLEAEIQRLRGGAEQRPQQQQQSAGASSEPLKEFLAASPGKLAKQLFTKEAGRASDPRNPEDLERLQELTSLVTYKQIEAGHMQAKVQSERSKFGREVLSWTSEVAERPELEVEAMSRYNELPNGTYKKMLTYAWDRLQSGAAGRDEFNLIREFFEETKGRMPRGSGVRSGMGARAAGVTAAINMPRTSDVRGSAYRGDDLQAMVESKLDRGEKLTAAEEKYIQSLI